MEVAAKAEKSYTEQLLAYFKLPRKRKLRDKNPPHRGRGLIHLWNQRAAAQGRNSTETALREGRSSSSKEEEYKYTDTRRAVRSKNLEDISSSGSS